MSLLLFTLPLSETIIPVLIYVTLSRRHPANGNPQCIRNRCEAPGEKGYGGPLAVWNEMATL